MAAIEVASYFYQRDQDAGFEGSSIQKTVLVPVSTGGAATTGSYTNIDLSAEFSEVLHAVPLAMQNGAQDILIADAIITKIFDTNKVEYKLTKDLGQTGITLTGYLLVTGNTA